MLKSLITLAFITLMSLSPLLSAKETEDTSHKSLSEDATQEEDLEGVSLEDYLKMILKSNPEILEAKQGIAFYKGFVDEANGASYPKITFLGIVAPIPAIKGDVNNSRIDWRKWGPLFMGQIDVQLPLYTFGRIPNGREAAINAMSAEKEKVREVKWVVIQRAKKIYYGYIFAYSAYHNVIVFAEENLSKAIETAEEEYDLGSGKVTTADVNRLKVGRAELLRRKATAEKFMDLTKTALARFIGYKDPDKLKIAIKEIEAEKVDLKPLEFYAQRGFQNNPQWNQLQYGIRARKAFLNFEKSYNYPVLFLGARAYAGYAPHFDDQKSYFANDPFNELGGAVFVGLKWELDFSRRGKIGRAEAEYKKLLEKEKFARGGIYLLIKKAYAEIEEAKKQMKADYDGYRAALAWMGFSFLAFQSGTGEAKDALEGLAAVAVYHYNYYDSIFNFNMALARLSQVVGEEVTQLKY
ncbi:MAG: RND transporter [bacterium]|nr:MAG: RND transporter [bacterium]